MNQEIWKPVVGFENKYLVSNHGRIWSFLTSKIRKLPKNNKGRALLGVWINGKTLSLSVSRIVAKVFLEDFDDNLEVDHIDGNKANDRADNLRILTHRENCMAHNKRNLGGTSQFRGVSRHHDKWQATVKAKGKTYYVGDFKSEITAAKARDTKALELGYLPEGLNFPLEAERTIITIEVI